MAPPPEYDKEPKAPDKSVTNISSEETKSIPSQANDQQANSDHKPVNATANNEVENNKHVEHLDDGQLKALLDEAITYKCPKDREGKSSLFNELLEEVEQDEQALEAAARELSGSRAARRAQRPRRHLAHSNSLQNLEQEALAAESALRRVRHAHPHSTVSARAIHGGSLPSDVDKSFLLGEEGGGGGRAGYLATVQCYNPPPLNERRVSASDANGPPEVELINRRSKPPFPMMYTARATLEIGSGGGGAARAATTTTSSNQVRNDIAQPKHLHRDHLPKRKPNTNKVHHRKAAKQCLTSKQDDQIKFQKLQDTDSKPRGKIDNQAKLLYALTKHICDDEGGGNDEVTDTVTQNASPEQIIAPRGAKNKNYKSKNKSRKNKSIVEAECDDTEKKSNWADTVNSWYDGLAQGYPSATCISAPSVHQFSKKYESVYYKEKPMITNRKALTIATNTSHNICKNINVDTNVCNAVVTLESNASSLLMSQPRFKIIPSESKAKQPTPYDSDFHPEDTVHDCKNVKWLIDEACKNYEYRNQSHNYFNRHHIYDKDLEEARKKYRERVGFDLVVPDELTPELRNIRSMTIGTESIDDFSYNNYSSLAKNYDDLRNIRSMTIGTDSIDDFSYKITTNLADNDNDYINLDYANNICIIESTDNKFDDDCDLNGNGIDIYNTSVRSSTPLPVNEQLETTKYKLETTDEDKSSQSVTNEEKEQTVSPPENPSIFEKDDAVNEIELVDFSQIKTSENIIENIDEENNIHNEIQPTANNFNLSKTRQESCLKEVNDRLIQSLGDDIIKGIELKDWSETKTSTNKTHKNEAFAIFLAEQRNLFTKLKHHESSNESTYINTDHLKDNKLECRDSIRESKCDNKTNKHAIKDAAKSQDSQLVVTNPSEQKSFIDLKGNLTEILKKKVQPTASNSNLSKTMNSKDSKFDDSFLQNLADDIIKDVELKDYSKSKTSDQKMNNVFSKFLTEQQNVFSAMRCNKSSKESRVIITDIQEDNTNVRKKRVYSDGKAVEKPISGSQKYIIEEKAKSQVSKELVVSNRSEPKSSHNLKCSLTEVPNNNACALLTVSNRLHTPLNSVQDITIRNDMTTLAINNLKIKDKCVSSTKKAGNRNVLKKILRSSLCRSDSSDKLEQRGVSASVTDEVDSTIPFNCISSSEVVDSCVTTTSTTQAAVADETKPLQLASSYCAVGSLTGAPPPPRSPPHHARTTYGFPRNLVASTFNGMSLARNNYGSTATTTADEYKKSLDENGNAVQGFSSPLSGSSQHKKPRRKKSSKNETVITSHQIDGYQGNKDLKELLRFIESNADSGRGGGGKLRAKHRDDCDDKGGKKRSADRRKDKEKMKRANSMEELSRTKLEDLTDKPVKKERWTEGAAKAERRSWGDESREGMFYREEVSDADFQTVTKKRKPRRRADEVARPARAPSPRASAQNSDRSNDSNDDMEERGCAAGAGAAVGASYAEIARTRHNIPDLIESCNYYAEEAPTPAPAPAALPPKEPYPALSTTHPTHQNNKTLGAAGEWAPSSPPWTGPAPDVVSDRRPPVVLLDCTTRPRDMDGVTFGFDINEQLLGGVSGRPRCDLVLDTVVGSASSADSASEAGEAGEASAASAARGRRGLRYVPPVTVPLNTHMIQIIDFVSSAWEEVVRCGGGKVRYFNE